MYAISFWFLTFLIFVMLLLVVTLFNPVTRYFGETVVFGVEDLSGR
jgi:hypothetical protein